MNRTPFSIHTIAWRKYKLIVKTHHNSYRRKIPARNIVSYLLNNRIYIVDYQRNKHCGRAKHLNHFQFVIVLAIFFRYHHHCHHDFGFAIVGPLTFIKVQRSKYGFNFLNIAFSICMVIHTSCEPHYLVSLNA